MPRIYLSPSTQDWNPYVDGSGSEEYWMNLLADTLEPYLYANTISFVRNTPEMTAASSIAQANSLGGFDFYLALHSNASGEEQAGKNRGIIVFYYPTSSDGKRAAELFAAQLRMVYPLPAKVTTQATTTLGEVRRPKYPANLIELGYHDNYDDARWIENNLDAAAQAIARGLTEYFGLPFIYPQLVRTGVVTTEGSALRLRSYPASTGKQLAASRTARACRSTGAIKAGTPWATTADSATRRRPTLRCDLRPFPIFSGRDFSLTAGYKKFTMFFGFMEGREGESPVYDSKTQR